MEREVRGGIGMGNTCKPMALSFQCMTKFTTNKKIIIIIIKERNAPPKKEEHGKKKKKLNRNSAYNQTNCMLTCVYTHTKVHVYIHTHLDL